MLVLEVDMDAAELDDPRAKWAGLTFEIVPDREGSGGTTIVKVIGDRDPLTDFVCWYSNDDIESAVYTMSFVKEVVS